MSHSDGTLQYGVHEWNVVWCTVEMEMGMEKSIEMRMIARWFNLWQWFMEQSPFMFIHRPFVVFSVFKWLIEHKLFSNFSETLGANTTSTPEPKHLSDHPVMSEQQQPTSQEGTSNVLKCKTITEFTELTDQLFKQDPTNVRFYAVQTDRQLLDHSRSSFCTEITFVCCNWLTWVIGMWTDSSFFFLQWFRFDDVILLFIVLCVVQSNAVNMRHIWWLCCCNSTPNTHIRSKQ